MCRVVVGSEYEEKISPTHTKPDKCSRLTETNIIHDVVFSTLLKTTHFRPFHIEFILIDFSVLDFENR